MEADSPTDVVTEQPDAAGGPDNYSRDMVEQLKRERLELSSKVAQLESRNTRLETRERDTLRALVPQMQTGTKMLMENPRYKDHAEDLKHMHDWAGSCVDRQDVETTTRLARFVHCASAEIATAHSEGTKMGDAAEELKRAHAELDEAKASTEVLSKKLRESQELQQEHYAQAQSFEKRLHTAGLVQEKHDFSKVASREVPPQKKQQEFDPLMAMIKAHSSGTCTTRLMPNDSTNAITGGATSSLPFSAYAI
tara:strand:- start:1628 stop:2383 length:756 start_codon:yes stop_codon:yes gene_type:complete